MPKLYEYLGLIIFFYSNEHEPVHVHARCQGREYKAELVVQNGRVIDVIYSAVKGRRPLTASEVRNLQQLIEHYAEEIVQKWIDYFVLHRQIVPQTITKRIK
jgi:hypothetical protein